MVFVSGNYLTPIFFMVFGFFLCLRTLFKKDVYKQLLTIGERVEAVIFKLGSDNFFEPQVKNLVTVRFETQKKEWITSVYKPTFGLFYTRHNKAGDKVEIVYNPDNPQEFEIISKQNPRMVRKVGLIIGIVMTVSGAYLFWINH